MKLSEVTTPALQLIAAMKAYGLKQPEVSVDLDDEGPSTVGIIVIWSKKKRKGLANAAMQKLVDEADRLQVNLKLNVHFLRDEYDDKLDDGPRNNHLEKWYKKFGFVRDVRTANFDIHSGEVDMERNPQ